MENQTGNASNIQLDVSKNEADTRNRVRKSEKRALRIKGLSGTLAQSTCYGVGESARPPNLDLKLSKSNRSRFIASSLSHKICPIHSQLQNPTRGLVHLRTAVLPEDAPSYCCTLRGRNLKTKAQLVEVRGETGGRRQIFLLCRVHRAGVRRAR